MTKIPPHRVQNLYSEREFPIKLSLGEKNEKKTNISPFSATHTYLKLTLVSFFQFFLRVLQNRVQIDHDHENDDYYDMMIM